MALSSVPARLGPFLVRHVLCTIGAGALLRVEDVQSGKPQTVMLLDPDQSCWPARLHDRRLLPSHPRLCSLSEGAPRVVLCEDRTLYYVGAEALSGWTVLDEISREGAIRPLSRAIRLCAEATDALACAHAAGLSHGHLEPGCLFVQTFAEEDEGHIKLLGVGLDVTAAPSSRAARYRDPEAAGPGTGAKPAPKPGSNLDMPGGAGDDRGSSCFASDLFAMGAVLYHMIVGHAPRVDKLVLPTLLGIGSERLDDFIIQALSADPAERFADAAQFREALLTLEGDSAEEDVLTPAMRLCPDVGSA